MAKQNPTIRIRPLKLTSSSRTLASKFYDDQLPGGEDAFINAVKNSASSERQIIAIKHNKSKNKEHWHLIERIMDDSDNIYVNTALHDLGIYYRKDTDDELIKNRGLETVGRFENYAAYLLHITEEAKAENKPEYTVEDMVSNLPIDEIKKIIAGCASKKHRMTKNDYIQLAHEAGEALVSFEDFINGIDSKDMTATLRKTLFKEFAYSADNKIKKGIRIPRLPVAIIIDESISRDRVVYSAQKALAGKKWETLFNNASYIYSDAIVSTNYNEFYCGYSVKRNKNEEEMSYSIWAGHYYIAVIQMERRYMGRYGQYNPSGMIVCSIKDDKLFLEKSPDIEEDIIEEVEAKYCEFRDGFNEAYEGFQASDVKTVKKSKLNIEKLNQY